MMYQAFVEIGRFIVIVLLGISIDTSIPESGVLIDFLGNSNSVQGPLAILQLRNNGKKPVRINAYCTIYWTNPFGASTNEFFQHNQGCAILRPGESNLVAVRIHLTPKSGKRYLLTKLGPLG